MKCRNLLLVIGTMAILAMLCGTAIAADTIKIAYIDPLSGAFAGVGDAG